MSRRESTGSNPSLLSLLGDPQNLCNGLDAIFEGMMDQMASMKEELNAKPVRQPVYGGAQAGRVPSKRSAASPGGGQPLEFLDERKQCVGALATAAVLVSASQQGKMPGSEVHARSDR